MQITVIVRTVYGVDKIYPACPAAQAFADIAGTKTLSVRDIANIKKLGFAVRVSHAHPMTELAIA